MTDFSNHSNFTKKQILDQTDKICSSEEFRSKHLLCLFLKFIITETLDGRGELLKGYTIGIALFNKSKHFDPEQDSLVRINAGRLRRSLELYYHEEGKNDTVQIRVPKGNYQPVFTSATNENHRHNLEPGIDLNDHASIGIFPFMNLTGDPLKEYLAFGLSEALTIILSKYEDLKVYNHWLRPENQSTGGLKENYGSRFLIDGSVYQDVEHYNIIVKLVNSNDHRIVWSYRYQINFDDLRLLKIQEEIAEEIAKTIGGETGVLFNVMAEEMFKQQPQQFTTFNSILKFYYYESHISPMVAEDTLHSIQNALETEPDSGILNAMLASMIGASYALDFVDGDKALEQMSSLADRAITLAPDDTLVRVIYATKYFLLNDKKKFDQERDYCLSMKIKSPGKFGALGMYTSLFGDWEEGKAMLDQAMNKQVGFPLYFHGPTCLYYYRKREYKLALAEACKYNVPGLFWGPLLRIAVYGQLNMPEAAAAENINLLNLKPDFKLKAEALISKFVKDEELADHILEGLYKAGLIDNISLQIYH